MKEFKKLSATELSFMNIIWESKNGASSDMLYSQGEYAVGTIGTILHRISQKGYIETIREGRHKKFIPTITKLEYQQTMIEQGLTQVFESNSIDNLIANFCGKEKLTKEQGDKLRDFMKEIQDE